MRTATAYRYRYAGRSTVSTNPGGAVLTLRTTPHADVFVDALVERADVAALGLLTVAEVAGSRFFVPSAVSRRDAAADPLVTAGDGTVRFESLSACAGVAARLDLLPGGLEHTAHRPGTTNVDVGPALRRLLAGVRRHEPMRVRAGADGLEVRTLDGTVHERVVDLPTRWVRSLAELPALTSRLALRHELDALGARRFVASLPARTPLDEPTWLQPVAGGLRLAHGVVPGGLRVGAPERLRLLAPLVRAAAGVRVYAADADHSAVSAWEVSLPGARLVLTLSPAASRGFSGEGALLRELATGTAAARALASGTVGLDLATGRRFERRLPYELDLAQAHPRLVRARRLVADGAVRLEEDRAVVASGTGRHVVRLGPAGPRRCSCPWFARHGGDRGPCAHVLAVLLVQGRAA